MPRTSRLALLALGLLLPACNSGDEAPGSDPGAGSSGSAGVAQGGGGGSSGKGGSSSKAGSGGAVPGGSSGSAGAKAGSAGSGAKAGTGGATAGAGGASAGGSAGSSEGGAPGTGGAAAGEGGSSGAGAPGGEGGSAGDGGSGASGGPSGAGGEGGSAGASAGGAGAGGSSAGPPGYGNDGYFEAPEPWTKDVSSLDKSEASDAIIGWLDGHGGWGTGQMRIDFTIEVLTADASTPLMGFTPTSDFFKPDCDVCNFPIPPGGAIEGEQGYQCVGDGDCHLIVHDTATKHLFEMWRANLYSGNFFGGCAAEWDLTKAYPESGRGDDCTSADAGGFPIAPMLFSADEIAAGEIDHAIRFILPNDRIRELVYVHPGTHSTDKTKGGGDAPPYGVRFRLRKDFPLESLPSDGARVIAKALQRYGMLLADGGDIALTARSDRFTAHKWSDVGVKNTSLSAIQVTDMEVVDMGELHPYGDNCVRNP